MITSQDREIQALVNDIRDGKLLLPEMQRGYVWKSPQVRNLFDSLYRGYPSGQLLIWETDDLPYAKAVSVDGLLTEQRRPQLLLDGQQRLTSLAAVMLGNPLKVRDSKKAIDIVFNVHTERFEVAGPRQSGDVGWISLTKLFTKGQVEILRDLKLSFTDPEAPQILERLKHLENIKTYKYRVNLLERLSYEEVTDIFIRINSGGTVLNNADLALAQISARWRGVTEEFHKFQWGVWNKHNHWLDNGILLRTMSLLLTNQSKLGQFFRGDHRRVAAEEIPGGWERARNGLQLAIEFLIQNCKIDRLSLLPTNYILITLATFFDRFGDQVSTTQSRDLKRWVYLALAWSRYSSASETALDQDYAALAKPEPIQAMLQNIEDKVGRGRIITERELRDQRKNSPFMVLSYVLARHAEAEDWFNGVKLGGGQSLELHHIFPKAVLAKRYSLKSDSLIVDQVANLAFISGKANGAVSSRAPAEYLPKLEESRLRAQYVPLDPALWTLEQFEEFAEQRRQMLADGLNKLILSLTEKPSLVPQSDIDLLESRIEALEHVLRDLVADRLTEAHGDRTLDHYIPKHTRDGIKSRLRQRLGKNPFEADDFSSLNELLGFCQFSDYARIMRDNWPLFTDVFGEGKSFDQHIAAVTTARNAFAHNNPIGKADLLSAEAGLIWVEECLRRLEQNQGVEAEDEDVNEPEVELA
jgi:hypothetical protein